MAETVWSVLPPVITIVLALATKEVYMSLLIGIFSGALLYTDFNVLNAIMTLFEVMADKVGGNINILIFLVILGILVAAIPVLAQLEPMVNGRLAPLADAAAPCC